MRNRGGMRTMKVGKEGRVYGEMNSKKRKRETKRRES
jgi:hypothetical protein